jgi:hypothetical protein
VDFIKEYMAAQKLAFLPETITKAWARCGIARYCVRSEGSGIFRWSLIKKG